MTALYGSPAGDGNGLDLDLRAGHGEPAHLDERARRTRSAEDLLANGVDLRPVVDVGQEHRYLDDVCERRAAGGEDRAHVRECLPRLLDDVLAPDQPAVLVDGDATGNEEEIADADGIRVMADRLRLSRHSNFFARHHASEDNRRRVEPQFVDFENIRTFELAAGVTGRPLFGEGAMLNLIEFAPRATVPLHRHEHEQLGIVLRGMQALVVDGVPHELGPLQGYVLPGGVEHSAYCGPEGALVLDVFRPVREDYRERWHSLS
jgi:quercetin dioxygenase-like cupin family protein